MVNQYNEHPLVKGKWNLRDCAKEMRKAHIDEKWIICFEYWANIIEAQARDLISLDKTAGEHPLGG